MNLKKFIATFLIITLTVTSLYFLDQTSLRTEYSETEKENVLADKLMSSNLILKEKILIRSPSIYIEKNSDFKDLGFKGNGLEGDPYIIENLVITSPNIPLIHIQDTTVFFEIRNCELDGVNQAYGIYLVNVKHANVTGNVIQNCKVGIYLHTVPDSSILRNTIANSLNDGISLWYSHNIDLNENICTENGFSGIFLGFSSENSLVNNLCKWNGYSGIYLLTSSGNRLVGNTCNSNSEDGISVTAGSDGNTLEANILSDNHNRGILVQESSFNQLSNNKVTGCTMGFLLYIGRNNSLSGNIFELLNHDINLDQIFGFHLSWCHNTSLSGNSVTVSISVSIDPMNVHIAGFYMQLSSNTTLDGNTIVISVNHFGSSEYQCHVYGFILLECHENRLSDNNILLEFQGDVFGYYLGVHLENSHNNTLSGNDVHISNDIASIDFESFGILLVECANHSLSGNTIYAHAFGRVYGIYLTWSHNNTCKTNTVSSYKTGITLLECDNNTVSGNTIIVNSGSEGYGFDMFGCYNNTLKGNDLLIDIGGESYDFNGRGFYLGECQNNTLSANDISLLIEGQGFQVYSCVFCLSWSHNNTLSGNTINVYLISYDLVAIKGFYLLRSHNNSISVNTVEHCDWGLYLERASHNLIFHNNIINNVVQGVDIGSEYGNYWYHPKFKEGNYWSDYPGVDDGSGIGKHAISGDSIGDTDIPWPSEDFDCYPYVIPNGWLFEAIYDVIQSLPDNVFINNAEQRKNAFSEKFDEVFALIDAGEYEEAIDKLQNDIRAKCDGSLGGNPDNDWITDPEAQQQVCAMIDELIAYLER